MAAPGGNTVSRLVLSDSHKRHEEEEFPLLTVAKPQLLNVFVSHVDLPPLCILSVHIQDSLHT